MTKEEVIKRDYKHYYNPHIDDNGWFDMKYYDYVFYNDYPKELWDLKNNKIRPKSLQGIETNNGWIKIESEEDLPNYNDENFYNVHDIDNNETCYAKTFDELEFMWKKGIITHYQPIEKHKPPIW